MYESRIAIAADHLTVVAVEGFPPEIDALARCNLSGYGFLRAAWYGAGQADKGRTLVLRGADGAPLAVIPTIAFGPEVLAARKVPGSYWPLRSPLIAPACGVSDLAHALGHPASYNLGAVWRIGPARADDPTITRVIEAAHLANWTILARPAGISWLVDLEAAKAKGWPRPSAGKKLRAAWRRLEALGTLRWHHVRGSGWSQAVLEDMGRIEAESWIARTTDGRGAKFMTPAQRAQWEDVLRDPVIAQSLSSVILTLDDRPITFSFDCDDGPVRYGIASSYVEDMKRFGIGKIVNYRSMEDALAAGQRVLDLGVGDSGYKEEMGAAEGYAMTDFLFVRSRTAAMMLARLWGEPLVPGSLAHLDQPGAERG